MSAAVASRATDRSALYQSGLRLVTGQVDAAPQPGAGVALSLLNSTLHAALVKVAARRSDVSPLLARCVSQHVAVHITLDSRRSAYGVFCGDSLTVYGEQASDIRILLNQFESVPIDRRAECLLQTVVHELAHVWGHMLGVKTASRGRRYHPKRYGRLAEALGLVTERHDKYGLRTVAFTAKALGEYADIDKALVVEMAAPKAAALDAGANVIAEIAPPTHISGSCACTPPRTIRMTRAQWLVGSSTCDVCHEQYLVAGSVSRHPSADVLVGAKVVGSIEKGNQ